MHAARANAPPMLRVAEDVESYLPAVDDQMVLEIIVLDPLFQVVLLRKEAPGQIPISFAAKNQGLDHRVPKVVTGYVACVYRPACARTNGHLMGHPCFKFFWRSDQNPAEGARRFFNRFSSHKFTHHF